MIFKIRVDKFSIYPIHVIQRIFIQVTILDIVYKGKKKEGEREITRLKGRASWYYLAIARIPSKFSSNVIDITAWNPSNAFESTKESIKREGGDQRFLRRNTNVCVCVYIYMYKSTGLAAKRNGLTKRE